MSNRRDAIEVTIGKPVTYGSLYGYLKRLFPVYRAGTSELLGQIKEEVVPDINGDEATCVYYTRTDSWRQSGQLRFYSSPAALLRAFGFAVPDSELDKPTDIGERVIARPPLGDRVDALTVQVRELVESFKPGQLRWESSIPLRSSKAKRPAKKKTSKAKPKRRR